MPVPLFLRWFNHIKSPRLSPRALIRQRSRISESISQYSVRCFRSSSGSLDASTPLVRFSRAADRSFFPSRSSIPHARSLFVLHDIVHLSGRKCKVLCYAIFVLSAAGPPDRGWRSRNPRRTSWSCRRPGWPGRLPRTCPASGRPRRWRRRRLRCRGSWRAGAR